MPVTGGETARRIWNFDPGRVRAVFLRVPGSDAVVELFEFAGVERHSASARPCDYGAGRFAGTKAIYLIDPDGYHVELFEKP